MKVVLQNLTKVFPSRNKKSNEEVIAVNDFTFEIPDGKLVGLLGPSGCGLHKRLSGDGNSRLPETLCPEQSGELSGLCGREDIAACHERDLSETL